MARTSRKTAGASHGARSVQGAGAAAAGSLRARVGLIVLAGVLTYGNSFQAPFMFDDLATIVENSQITHLLDLTRTLSPPANTAVAGRPLVNLTFAINHAAGGFDVAGYHAVNLAVHLLCAVLLFGIARRTFERVSATAAAAANLAFAVALLWTVHPLNSEVVDYLTQRTESLMALCYLFTLYASIRAHVSTRRAGWLSASVLACLAGAGCKETIATAPIAVFLWDRVFGFESVQTALRARRRYYAALAATWVVMAMMVMTGGQSVSGGFETARISPWTYFLNQPEMIIRYFWLAAWPHSLVLYYGWPQRLTLPEVWPMLALVGAIFVAVIGLLIKRPALGFAAFWVFLTLGPSSSIVPIGTEVGAERRMYLPLAGLLALAVVGVAASLKGLGGTPRPLRRWQPTVVIVLVATLLGARTFVRNREFSSPLTMALTVLDRRPTANAHYLVGTELAAAGQPVAAVEHLRAAAAGYPPARYSLGSVLLRTGHDDEAIVELERFTRDEPRALAARSAHGLLANAYAEQRRFAEAAPHYREYLAAYPRDGNAWNGLGIAQFNTDGAVRASESFRMAAQSDPANVRFQLNFARALLESGAFAEANRVALETARTHPDDPAVYDILGRVLMAEGRREEARRAFERALQLDPRYGPAAEALAGLGGRTH